MKVRHSISAAFVLLILGVSAGCLKPAKDETALQIPLTVIFDNTQCGAASPEFRAIWFKYPGQLDPLPGHTFTPNPIDSSAWDPQTEGGLLLNMGIRRTGGFHLELDQHTASLYKGVATITIRLVAPKAGMMTTQVITSPCLLLKMPKSGVRQIEIRDQNGRLLSQIQVPTAS